MLLTPTEDDYERKAYSTDADEGGNYNNLSGKQLYKFKANLKLRKKDEIFRSEDCDKSFC